MDFNNGSHTLILDTGRATYLQFLLKAGYIFADLHSVILVRFVTRPQETENRFCQVNRIFLFFFVVAEKAMKLQSCY